MVLFVRLAVSYLVSQPGSIELGLRATGGTGVFSNSAGLRVSVF